MNEPRNIMVVKFKTFERKQVLYVFEVTGDEVVHTDNAVALGDKSVAEVRAQKTRGTGNKNALHESGCECTQVAQMIMRSPTVGLPILL